MTDLDIKRGFKAKTIRALLNKKMSEWLKSIDDEDLRKAVRHDLIVTGGCIASMLLGETVNDFDVYFARRDTAKRVAEYYVHKFNVQHSSSLEVDAKDERVRIVVKNGHRGATAGDVTTLDDSGTIEDVYEAAGDVALQQENKDDRPPYMPVFLSTNAITLTGKLQIILRFFGDPEEIHANYDFVHCTNYWTMHEDKLVLRPDAMEALLARELRYVGSKYPVCSVIRLRKFIRRGWTINAGQILKMMMQINDLDLKDTAVLEDQLTGVDSAYFCQIIDRLREKDPDWVNTAYLVEIIDRMF